MSFNDPKNGGMFSVRNVAIGGLAIVGLAMLYNSQAGKVAEQKNREDVSYTHFKSQVARGTINQVTESRDPATGQISYIGISTTSGKRYRTNDVANKEMADLAEHNGGTMEAAKVQPPSMMMSMLFTLLPVALLAGVMIWLYKRNSPGGGGAGRGINPGQFGSSRAKLVGKDKPVKFADVAGIDECKEELIEIVDFLKDPARLARLGGRVPSGVIMAGPPGTGKTLMAKAVAGEAGVPCFTVAGSEFVEMFVGVGASRVRDMFDNAKKNAPCVLFIDEIDAIGKKRGGGGPGGGNDEREQTLNQILVEMDGFDTNPGVIVIAATNRIDVLDDALIRPGRFDRQVHVPLPDLKGRAAILKTHCRNKPIADNVNLLDVARSTPGFSGADLENVANEAALMGARRDARAIEMIDFIKAVDKTIMGPERKSFTMTPEDLKVTAYHEAGHAIAHWFQPEIKAREKLHKLSIIPRGRALGVTVSLPENDRVSVSREELKAQMAKLYAGRMAELITFGPDKITGGASNDIMRATNIANAMVKEYGMSDNLPMRKYTPDQQTIFGSMSDLSPEVMQLVDSEMDSLMKEAGDKAKDLILQHTAEYELLAQALLEFETLEAEDIESLLTTGSADGVRKRFEAQRAAEDSVPPPGNDNNPPPPNRQLPKPGPGGWSA